MSNSMKGVIAGFIATLVVSAVILLKVQFHIVPDELSIIVCSAESRVVAFPPGPTTSSSGP